LKILPLDTAGDPGFAERFTREARALAKLSHPNIVALYDFGRVDGLHYFIMEYVDGLNLRQLETAGKLSPQEALRIVPQVCEALQFAHEAGIVHRDVKPENILLDQKGRVKIADFGIAKILGGGQVRQTLTQNQVLGTPHYMAPEQVEHPHQVDRRADIYSLGVVFYEMLTGELPLGKFALPSRKVQVDVRLDEVVLHALEKEPDRRYQQASEVKTDVELIATGSAQANPALVSSPHAEELIDSARRRRRMLWYGFIVSLTGLPVGLVLKLPMVWALSICGIIVGALKLGLFTRWLGNPGAGGETLPANPSVIPPPRPLARRSQPGSNWPFVLCLLPPVLLTAFVLFGYRWVGVDLDADVQVFTGLLGLPLSAGLGALLGWGAWLFVRSGQPRGRESSASASRWSWLALGAAAVLAISLPLGGGAMALLQLVSKETSWNPGKGEYLMTILVVGGASLSALSATVMGLESSRQIRRAPSALRGRLGACAAAWFWPCLLGCVAILWGGNAGLTALRGGVERSSAGYETAPVTRGPMTVDVVASGRLVPAAGDRSQWQIEASVPETIVAYLEVGQDVECVADAFSGQAFKGKLARIADAPEPGPETAKYAALIQVVDARLPFRQGMSVFLTFVIAHRQDTLRIPCQALWVQMPGWTNDPKNLRYGLMPKELTTADAAERATRTVWVLRAPKKAPEPVKVSIGISDSTWTEIVEGLNEGDCVVIGTFSREKAAPRPSRNAPGIKNNAHERATTNGRASMTNSPSPAETDDVANVLAQEKLANGDSNQRFFLIGPKPGDAPPTNGYSLLLVLPGGDGGSGFVTFVKRIYLHAVPAHYIVAELIAPRWDEAQAEQIVWPTETSPYPGMKFSTEAFVHSVIGEIEKQYRLDSRRVFTLSWSSGGPAGYAASLCRGTRVTGSLIAMSVFRPLSFPDLKSASGQAYFLLHSADDALVPIDMARNAQHSLTLNGAQATLETYPGGHGWRGDIYGNINAGIRWLEEHAMLPTAKARADSGQQ
ncbi:MAG TPA: protein kinase, partial [Verrucomicrobiae bacterium]